VEVFLALGQKIVRALNHILISEVFLSRGILIARFNCTSVLAPCCKISYPNSAGAVIAQKPKAILSYIYLVLAGLTRWASLRMENFLVPINIFNGKKPI
jgi:hypothetical protein